MRKFEAATRDRSAATWRERKVMYKVGHGEVGIFGEKVLQQRLPGDALA